MTYQIQKIICRGCGAKVIKTNSHQTYCGRDCHVKMLKDKSRPAPNKTARSCETCGETFYVINGKRILANQRFCSHKCSRPVRPKTKPCANCGKDFNCSRAMDKYCSLACRRKHYYQSKKAAKSAAAK